MGGQSQLKHDVIRVIMDPGICGLPCVVETWKEGPRTVSIKITDSECKPIQRLSKLVKEITWTDLFTPITRNPIFVSAERAGCHSACPVPVAVMKAVEVAMDMALPQDVVIRFE